MNTLQSHKEAILNTKSTIKEVKGIAHTATDEQKNDIISVIFEARQLQHTQVELAKKEYPGVNWYGLI